MFLSGGGCVKRQEIDIVINNGRSQGRAVATSPVGTVSTGPLFRAVPKKIFLKIFSLVTKGETISNSTQITWVSLLESGGPTLKLLPL